jgi:TnpA family transposase
VRYGGRGVMIYWHEVGFAFSDLLGFELLPRLKNLKEQRLYRPQSGAPEKYANLQPILTRSINWEIIEQQYDEAHQVHDSSAPGNCGC